MNMGVAELMFLTCDRPDMTVSILKGLKERTGSFLRESGCSSRASFSCHVGEITPGPLSRPSYIGRMKH